MAAGEGDEARTVVQFILDAVREIEERASAIGRETTKSKNLSGKKNTKNTNKKGQKRKRGGKGGKTNQSAEPLEVIEEVQEEEEEKENKQSSQPQSQPSHSVNSSMILEGEGVELEVEDEESIRLSQDDENIFSQPLPGEQQEQQEQQEKEEELSIREETQPIESEGKEIPLKGDSDSFDDEPEY